MCGSSLKDAGYNDIGTQSDTWRVTEKLAGGRLVAHDPWPKLASGSSECRIGAKADYVRDTPVQVSPHLGFFVYVVVGATLCGNTVSLAGKLELLVRTSEFDNSLFTGLPTMLGQSLHSSGLSTWVVSTAEFAGDVKVKIDDQGVRRVERTRKRQHQRKPEI